MNSTVRTKPAAVILSGGSGGRLWPLSRTDFPKQFIPLADGHSLFARTVNRARQLGCERVVVVCNEAHRFYALEELRAGGVEDPLVLLEPAARNTAPAVALAALAMEAAGPAPLLVLPSDHYIADLESFAASIDACAAAVEQSFLVTFGIRPAYPETGYGYIIAGDDIGGGVCRVAEFAEKPDLERARDYIAKENCHWNSGMFLFNAADYLSELQRHAPQVSAACRRAWDGRRTETLMGARVTRVGESHFAACPGISMDHAVMEKTANAAVLPCALEWSDLGSWKTLAGIFAKDANGNAAVGDVVLEDSRDNIVYASRRLVAAVGVDNHIVVETPDAVLVASLAGAQSVKNVAARLRAAGRPEGESHTKVNRPWGSYEVVVAGSGFQVKRLIVAPGQKLSLQLHRRRSEHWIVVRGIATVTVDDEVFELGAGQSTHIPVGAMHRLENRSGEHLHLVEVQVGDYLGEDDIRRFEDIYGRVLDTPERESTPSPPIFQPKRGHKGTYGCQKIRYHGGFIDFIQSQLYSREL